MQKINSDEDAVQWILDSEDEDDEVKTWSARLVDLQKIVNASEEKQELLLRSLVNTIRDGVIIYCSYHHTVEIVEKLLNKHKIQYKVISGKIGAKKRKEFKEWFIDDTKNKVMIITAAGSQSLNLQATNNFIFYDIPFSIGAYAQAMGRIVRIFSEHTEFNIYYIVVKESIDQYKYDYVSANRDLLSKIYNNEGVHKGALPSFNTEILKKLRKKLLWKT